MTKKEKLKIAYWMFDVGMQMVEESGHNIYVTDVDIKFVKGKVFDEKGEPIYENVVMSLPHTMGGGGY